MAWIANQHVRDVEQYEELAQEAIWAIQQAAEDEFGDRFDIGFFAILHEREFPAELKERLAHLEVFLDLNKWRPRSPGWMVELIPIDEDEDGNILHLPLLNFTIMTPAGRIVLQLGGDASPWVLYLPEGWLQGHQLHNVERALAVEVTKHDKPWENP